VVVAPAVDVAVRLVTPRVVAVVSPEPQAIARDAVEVPAVAVVEIRATWRPATHLEWN
jgi:hypothetical protein